MGNKDRCKGSRGFEDINWETAKRASPNTGSFYPDVPCHLKLPRVYEKLRKHFWHEFRSNERIRAGHRKESFSSNHTEVKARKHFTEKKERTRVLLKCFELQSCPRYQCKSTGRDRYFEFWKIFASFLVKRVSAYKSDIRDNLFHMDDVHLKPPKLTWWTTLKQLERVSKFYPMQSFTSLDEAVLLVVLTSLLVEDSLVNRSTETGWKGSSISSAICSSNDKSWYSRTTLSLLLR